MERSFTQTSQDVTVIVPLGQQTRAKSLDVDIGPKSLAIKNRATNHEISQGESFAEISPDDSTWWIEDNTISMLTLEKRNKQQWWPHVLVTDPKIDLSKIQPEQSKLSDLDPETRATVEKMMFDQQQKQMNKPTSDESKKQQTFEKFKQMHPELDFSQAKSNF